MIVSMYDLIVNHRFSPAPAFRCIFFPVQPRMRPQTRSASASLPVSCKRPGGPSSGFFSVVYFRLSLFGIFPDAALFFFASYPVMRSSGETLTPNLAMPKHLPRLAKNPDHISKPGYIGWTFRRQSGVPVYLSQIYATRDYWNMRHAH